MCAGARSWLRWQDADPPGPDRSLQCDLYAAGGGSCTRAQDHSGVRAAGERLARRDPARRSDGGAAARRYGKAHDCDRGRDRGDGELNLFPPSAASSLLPLWEKVARTKSVPDEGLPCSLLCCHHPRKRMIQYSAPLKLSLNASEYWMPAFAGMTLRRPKPLRRPCIQAAGNRGLIAATFRRNVKP